MDVHFTPDVEQEAFIRIAMENGRLRNPEDAMREAMTLWKDRERRRAELLSDIEQAEQSISNGLFRVISSQEGADRLAEDVKRRGLARLANEGTPL